MHPDSRRHPHLPRAALACLLLAALPAAATDYAGGAGPDSRLGFTAEQQGAEFQGRFESFRATLRLVPGDADASRLEATIDLTSVNTDYPERDGYLRGEEWFATERWPTAQYTAERITARGDGSYLAEGELQLRGETRPLGLEFRFADGQFSGQATLDRRDFGVGQGMWADERMVGAEVTVKVDMRFDAVD